MPNPSEITAPAPVLVSAPASPPAPPRPALERTQGVPRGMLRAEDSEDEDEDEEASRPAWLCNGSMRSLCGCAQTLVRFGSGLYAIALLWMTVTTCAALVRRPRTGAEPVCGRPALWDACAILVGTFTVAASLCACLVASGRDDKTRAWLVIGLVTAPGPVLGVIALTRSCVVLGHTDMSRLALAWTVVVGAGTSAIWLELGRAACARRAKRLSGVGPALPEEAV